MATRRDILRGGGAALAALALPAVPAVAPAPAPAPAAPIVPRLLGWSVGQEDRMNWRPIFAETKQDAIAQWLDEEYGGPCCDDCGFNLITGEPDPEHGLDEDCTCRSHGIGIHRSKAFDPYVTAEKVPPIALHRDGWCNLHCDRCDTLCEETASYDVHTVVAGQLICEDCMTLADWQIADPQYYAEMVDDLLTTEYGEASITPGIVTIRLQL